MRETLSSKPLQKVMKSDVVKNVIDKGLGFGSKKKSSKNRRNVDTEARRMSQEADVNNQEAENLAADEHVSPNGSDSAYPT
jgi:hypothetical protein